MTRAMPKAVVIRVGEPLPLMPKIWRAKSVSIVAGMLPAASRLVTGQSTVPLSPCVSVPPVLVIAA